jgi:hypothetical protein
MEADEFCDAYVGDAVAIREAEVTASPALAIRS